MRFEERDVLEEELLLQVLGAGGDDDALLAFAGQAQGGQQIGQRLAGPGAGFDDQVALVGEGLFDGARPSRTGPCDARRRGDDRDSMPLGEKKSCRLGSLSA